MVWCRRTRILILSLLLLAAIAVAGSAAEPLPLTMPTGREPSAPPNIVVILLDDLGYADLTGEQPLPNLNRLARQGRTFTRFYVAEAASSGSRAALLTGCYPNRISLTGELEPDSRIGIAAEELTLAEVLKRQNYATGLFGIWHLGSLPEFLPTRHGFDQFYGLAHPVDASPDPPVYEGERVVIPALSPDARRGLTRDFTRRAVRFVEANVRRPFFLQLNLGLPRAPRNVSDRFKGRSTRGPYADALLEIDWSVSEIVRALARVGAERNTLIVVTSDNGPQLSHGDHAGSAFPLREGWGTSWEGGVRVPCIMRWPARIPAGTTSPQPVMTIDLLPTFAALAGAALPEQSIDGLDVRPILLGDPFAESPHEAFYFYSYPNDLEAMLSGDGRWKLVFPHTYPTLSGRLGGVDGQPVGYDAAAAELALYDLSMDEGERINLADRYPGRVSAMSTKANEQRAVLGDSLLGVRGAEVRPAGRVP